MTFDQVQEKLGTAKWLKYKRWFCEIHKCWDNRRNKTRGSL
jgi:hypothetical protein